MGSDQPTDRRKKRSTRLRRENSFSKSPFPLINRDGRSTTRYTLTLLKFAEIDQTLPDICCEFLLFRCTWFCWDRNIWRRHRKPPEVTRKKTRRLAPHACAYTICRGDVETCVTSNWQTDRQMKMEVDRKADRGTDRRINQRERKIGCLTCRLKQVDALLGCVNMQKYLWSDYRYQQM